MHFLIRCSLSLLVLMSLSVSAFAQASTMNMGGPSDSTFYTEVPFEVLRNKIIVTVEIGGKPHKFLLDTGAPMLLSSFLSQELNPEVLSVVRTSDANGNTDSLSRIVMPDWTLGGITFSGVPGLVVDFPILSDCFGIEGFIGSNALRGTILQFDKKKGLLILTNQPEKLVIDEAFTMPMELDFQSGPILSVLLGKKASHSVLFDTGADTFFDLGNSSKERLLKKKHARETAKGYGSNSMSLFGLEAPLEKSRLHLPDFTLAGTRFVGVVTETSADEESRLGASVLDKGVVTLNYRDKSFSFSPYLPGPAQICDSTPWDINPTQQDGKYIIGTTWKTDDPWLQPGNLILEIDGEDLREMKLCTGLVYPPLADKTSATLLVRKPDGSEQEVIIYKR